MKDLLLSYARDLDDAYPNYEFSIWGRQQLLDYFNEALCIIAAQRPELFVELKVLPVKGCTVYVKPCDCVQVVDVLGQCDADGNLLNVIGRKVPNGGKWVGKPIGEVGYVQEIESYEILKAANLIRLFPDNLDPTVEYFLLLRCIVPPKVYTIDDAAPDTSCVFVSAARQYVLYCAKSMDGEHSQTMLTQAKQHLDTFYTILNIAKQADTELEEKIQKAKV